MGLHPYPCSASGSVAWGGGLGWLTGELPDRGKDKGKGVKVKSTPGYDTVKSIVRDSIVSVLFSFPFSAMIPMRIFIYESIR